jgi:histidine ammonia-lyase
MRNRIFHACRHAVTIVPVLVLTCAGPTRADVPYHPIVASLRHQTVILTGRTLTIEQIVDVARHGAKVELDATARQRQADGYGLLLEAAAEGIPVYWFNRGVGDQREIVMFEGDALSPANRAAIEQRQTASFRRGAVAGIGPEVEDEDLVRAMMVVRANTMVYNAPSPQLAQRLLDLLNKRITPVVQSRGTLGEADLAQLGNVGATMVGAGDAYFEGVRMPAAQALKRAGLAPIQPFAADDNALTSSNAYATGQAALLVADARTALEWADVIYAVDLNGMNSSITPLSLVVQRDRPERWLNWHAASMLEMVRGSYLFDLDDNRIIQDPESLRASSIRQAAAWEEWAALMDAVIFQSNSSDHNPAVSLSMRPEDSWELSSPQMMHFHVKGGPLSRGQQGYIVSNANWDPYPLANKLENFVIALANMDVAVTLRIERLRNPFFTGVKASTILPGAYSGDFGYAPVDLQQEVQSLMNPVAPMGAAIVGTVEDLQAQTRIKVQRARKAVDVTFDLLAFDLLEGSLWMDVRATQDPRRKFGTTATGAWTALRTRLPLHKTTEAEGSESAFSVARHFITSTPASTFYPNGARQTRPVATNTSDPRP